LSDSLRPWKTLSRQTILDHSKYLSVEEHVVELPDGRVIEHWPWIITPDFVNVVAITTGGEFLCFRQTKYGVEGTSLSVVGGYIDPGEDPLTPAVASRWPTFIWHETLIRSPNLSQTIWKSSTCCTSAVLK
jgi:hypothetical protein